VDLEPAQSRQHLHAAQAQCLMQRVDRFLRRLAEAGWRALQIHEVRAYGDPGIAVLEQVEAAAGIQVTSSLCAHAQSLLYQRVVSDKGMGTLRRERRVPWGGN